MRLSVYSPPRAWCIQSKPHISDQEPAELRVKQTYGWSVLGILGLNFDSSICWPVLNASFFAHHFKGDNKIRGYFKKWDITCNMSHIETVIWYLENCKYFDEEITEHICGSKTTLWNKQSNLWFLTLMTSQYPRWPILIYLWHHWTERSKDSKRITPCELTQPSFRKLLLFLIRSS